MTPMSAREVMGLLALVVAAATQFGPVCAQGESTLKVEWEITWREGASYPITSNGAAVGTVNGRLVVACGFSQPHSGDLPRAAHPQSDRFLKMANLYVAPENRWQPLPKFPEFGRAYPYGVAVGDALYVIGGLEDYTLHVALDEVWRLREDAQEGWVWEQMPSLHERIVDTRAVAVETAIYVLGGAWYDSSPTGRGFETQATGRYFASLDTTNYLEGWRRLPDFPGTQRVCHAMAVAGGRIYVLGGCCNPRDLDDPAAAAGCNCVDNWAYDPTTAQWQRLANLPYPCGGWTAVTLEDRYIFIFGGYRDRPVLTPKGRIEGDTQERRAVTAERFCSEVLVYDTQEDRFCFATPMPYAWNDTRAAMIGPNTVAVVGGEIPGGNRQGILLIGEIRKL